MSKNFELLRRVQKSPDALEPIGAEPSLLPARYEPPSQRAFRAPDEPSDWLRALHIIEKHWKLSAGVAFLILASVAAVTFLMRPVYEPEARLEVDPPGAELFKLEGAGGAFNDTEFLETQAQDIQSDQLAVEVIRNLGLANNSDLVDTKSVEQVAAEPPNTTTLNLKLSPAEHAALRAFNNRLKVKREPNSRLITVAFGAHDPQLAATITNTLLSTFIERSHETRHQAVMQSTEWLTKQLDDIKQRTDQSNRALAEFQKQTGIVDNNMSTFTEQMVELNKQLTLAQADRIQLQAYLDKVKSGPESLPQISADPVIQNLTQQLAQSRADYAQALGLYGKNHPSAKRLENQINELDAQLTKQRANIMGDIKTSYAAARAREGLMNSEMQGTTRKLSLMAEFNALKKEADANSELYNSLYAKVKEAGIAAASKSSNVRIVDQARILDRPTRPRRMLNLALGLFAALLGGIVAAFVREGIDTTIRTPDDIRKALGYSAVSIVPVLGAGNSRYGIYGTRAARLLNRSSKEAFSPTFLIDRPDSPEAEALRGLQTSVKLSRPGHPLQALLIVSPFPGEGKTTLATNLALALAQQARTCLLDADLRKSGVAEILGLPNDKGLSELLSGTLQLEEVQLAIADSPNLTIITTGAAVANPGMLITSDRMAELLKTLRTMYDHVVIDSPPILPFADGRALSPLVDGVVLVGRSGSTTREAMARSVELLEGVHSAPLVDVVLNAADFHSPTSRYYRYGNRYRTVKAS
jgi:capsular exopolysaccharide synthesis family protein